MLATGGATWRRPRGQPPTASAARGGHYVASEREATTNASPATTTASTTTTIFRLNATDAAWFLFRRVFELTERARGLTAVKCKVDESVRDQRSSRNMLCFFRSKWHRH